MPPAAPDAFVQISTKDVERLDVVEGEMLEVASRRGNVRAPAQVVGIVSARPDGVSEIAGEGAGFVEAGRS